MYDDVTPADVERIEQWAKETISDTDDQAQWHKCMAETLIDTGNFLAAIPRTREAIKLRPNDWRLKFSLVESQFLAKDPKSALESIENLFKDHGALLDNSADEHYEFYHRTLLPYYGNLQRELKDYAAAETTYSDLLKEAMKRPDIDGLFQESLVHMINILRLQHKHEDVLQFLRDLDAQAHKKEGGSWLTAAMYFYSPHGELHEPIWDSARRLGQLEFLEERYRKALEVHVSEPEGDVEWVIHLYLGFCHSCVLRATATPENRLRALEELEENLYRPLSEELKDNYNVEEVMALHTVRLAVDLLDMAKENGLSLPLSPEAARYAARLEKLTQLRSQQDYQDPHLTLARFWHLAGDEKRAKDAVREYLQHGMEWMRTMDNFKNGVYRLAVTLQAVDDDVNAIAAWSQFWPTRMNDDGEFVLNYVDDEKAMKELAEAVSQNEGTTVASQDPAPEGAEEQAVAGAEREDTDEQSLDQRKPATPENPADDPEPAKPATPKPQKLEGFLTSSCDGDCDIKWTYIDRTIYSCKDCLDVQFEEGCYKKLLAGELNTTVCSPKHTHLVIPAFDLEKWKELPDPSKQCWVGGEIRGDKEWSEEIKVAWGIDEESLKKKRRFVEGVRKVQRLWRVRRKVAGEVEGKTGAGMLVRRGTSFQNHLAGGASGVVSPA